MSVETTPETVLTHLNGGRLKPLYLFYGPDDFHLEKILEQIREKAVPESARDFNVQVFDGEGGVNPGHILDAARSLPFLSGNRLIIVRRTDRIAASDLEILIPYVKSPVETTCIIFVAQKPDFRLKFFSSMRKQGHAVHFKELTDAQAVPWIMASAREMGLNISQDACRHLHGMIGNRSRALYTELEKLHLRHGTGKIGTPEIKELSIFSRMYTIFELMDEISQRGKARSLSILNRYLEEEGKDAAFGIIGMLTRQIRIIFQAKELMSQHVSRKDMAKKLGVPAFVVGKILGQARRWQEKDLEKALMLLYQADGSLKSGSQAPLVLENFLLSI
ncbi:DNA polymerase III, delta subunit [delta proteobacterium NaphS2]|nr:DNA polymerase III, delta subunit [delta proteobacterium NaphS2]